MCIVGQISFLPNILLCSKSKDSRNLDFVAWSLGYLTPELREIMGYLWDIFTISLRDFTLTDTWKSSTPSFPLICWWKVEMGLSATDTEIIESPVLLKKFSVNLLSPEHMSWGSIKNVKLKFTSWGLTRDAELVPCFVSGPHKMLVSSISVVT